MQLDTIRINRTFSRTFPMIEGWSIDLSGQRKFAKVVKCDWRPDDVDPHIRLTYWYDVGNSVWSRAAVSFDACHLHGGSVCDNYHSGDFSKKILPAVAGVLTKAFDIPFYGVELLNWHVTRLDIGWNYDLGDKFSEVYRVASTKRISRNEHVAYANSLYWRTKTQKRSVVVYDKSKHNGCGDGILRFEVRNFPNELGKLEKSHKLDDRTLRRFTDSDLCMAIGMKWVSKLGLAGLLYEHDLEY